MPRAKGASSHLAVIAFVLLVEGCTAGRGVFFVPDTRAQYECGPYTVRPDGIFADGFAVLYYIVPLAPLFHSSDTPSRLEVDITVHSVQPVFEVSEDDVRIRLSDPDVLYRPIARTVKTNSRLPEKPWYYQTTRFTFDLDRSTISNYVLTFPSGLHGCRIPDTAYRKEVRTEMMTPVLGR